MGSKWSACVRRASLGESVSRNEDKTNRNVIVTYQSVEQNEETSLSKGLEVTSIRQSSPQLTDAEIKLLLHTWDALKHEVSKVGVVMFMRLFETHPDVQQSFQPFKDLPKDELMLNKELRTHALRVMGTVEKVLSRVHDPPKYKQLLNELGKRHVGYQVRPNYILLMAPQFINALHSAMGDHWTPEIEQAWYSLFVVINFHIINGMSTQ